ncbi:MAG: EAL domain-containing protein [Pseudomonadota bacterium]
MKKPQNPEGEVKRLSALLQTGLLDSPDEDRFDRFTRLAQQLFDVPIALISLIDSERQWFKSKQGLSATETDRSISFCGHAILQTDIFEVPDAREDSRFADNPLVTGAPFIRYYAGAPLHTKDGYPVGTLCIIDKKTRQLSEAQRHALRDLADAVENEMNHVERHKLYGEYQSLQELSEVIVRAQSNFIRLEDRTEAFQLLLEDILKVTDSEYGFIGDVLFDSDDQPYLKAYAITDIAWNEETRALYAENADSGLEFHNLHTLIGATLNSREPTITNEPSKDSRSGGLPKGHPALNAFLGIPILSGGKLVAMVGLANRPGGYDEQLLKFLNPLLLAIGQIVEASIRRRQQAELKQELSRLSAVASQTTNAVIITDKNGITEWVNDGFTRLTGYTPDDIYGHKPGQLLQGPATDPGTVATMRKALRKNKSFQVDVINYSRVGDAYWVRIYCNPMNNEDGSLQGFIAIQTNIDTQKKNELALKEFSQLQTVILDTMVDGLITTNQDGIIQMCNPSIDSMFGYSEEWLVGRNIKVIMPDNYAHMHDGYMKEYKQANSGYDIMGRARALTAKRQNGDIFPVEIAVRETEHNAQVLYVASIRDISALQRQQEEIEKLAYFDPLTQLANRRLLKARTQSLFLATAETKEYHGLLFLDLDNFKNVNDTLGHSVGDKLLTEVGERIRSSVLSCSDTVARLGGDEFCVLLSSLDESHAKAKAHAIHIAERIITEVEKPVMIDDVKLKTSASIGITFFSGEQVELDPLMKQADIAMYEAKEHGKSRVCCFDADSERRLQKRVTMESDLRVAVAEDELSVHYQPVVDDSSRIVKVEALVRWHHPTEGWIPPDVFIPIAEAFKLIISLGNFVLKTAIKDMESWMAKDPSLNWQVAINISQFQLSYEHFESQTKAALKDSKLDPSQLVFEITESALAQDIDKNIERMKALQSLGLAFSLDDFGTGYSSLAYLKQLPISELKIDRSFIRDVPDQLDDVAIVNSILSLAKAMDLNVLAEGVETNRQWQYLISLNCKLFQGYYFSKPLPAGEIENLIEQQHHHALIQKNNDEQ